MWDIAPEFGAMLVFAEHRYYGESLPFGAESSSKDPLKVGYLSSSQVMYLINITNSFTMNLNFQALADYVDLISFLRKTIEGASQSPVITFGGSYGGMLAAWIRTKYPHIVQVAFRLRLYKYIEYGSIYVGSHSCQCSYSSVHIPL